MPLYVPDVGSPVRVVPYPQLMLTTVGLLALAPDLLLCHKRIVSNALAILIPLLGSNVPSSPPSFCEYILAFLAQPNVLPEAIPAQ